MCYSSGAAASCLVSTFARSYTSKLLWCGLAFSLLFSTPFNQLQYVLFARINGDTITWHKNSLLEILQLRCLPQWKRPVALQRKFICQFIQTPTFVAFFWTLQMIFKCVVVFFPKGLPYIGPRLVGRVCWNKSFCYVEVRLLDMSQVRVLKAQTSWTSGGLTDRHILFLKTRTWDHTMFSQY